MKTIPIEPIHVDTHDSLSITYTRTDGTIIRRLFHSFDRPRIFTKVIVDECTEQDKLRFGIDDGLIIVLGH